MSSEITENCLLQHWLVHQPAYYCLIFHNQMQVMFLKFLKHGKMFPHFQIVSLHSPIHWDPSPFLSILNNSPTNVHHLKSLSTLINEIPDTNWICFWLFLHLHQKYLKYSPCFNKVNSARFTINIPVKCEHSLYY